MNLINLILGIFIVQRKKIVGTSMQAKENSVATETNAVRTMLQVDFFSSCKHVQLIREPSNQDQHKSWRYIQQLKSWLSFKMILIWLRTINLMFLDHFVSN
jgi:hypothetical protein